MGLDYSTEVDVFNRGDVLIEDISMQPIVAGEAVEQQSPCKQPVLC